MNWIIYLIAGIFGGVLGGMGMGGGTLLIPILTIFCKTKQHVAQAINLISFIPMAIIALIIHAKNHLIELKKVLWIIIPGLVFCILGCLVSKAISNAILSKLFGGFLALLSVFQFVNIFRAKNK